MPAAFPLPSSALLDAELSAGFVSCEGSAETAVVCAAVSPGIVSSEVPISHEATPSMTEIAADMAAILIKINFFIEFPLIPTYNFNISKLTLKSQIIQS